MQDAFPKRCGNLGKEDESPMTPEITRTVHKSVFFADSQVTYALRRFAVARANGELPARWKYYYGHIVIPVILVACAVETFLRPFSPFLSLLLASFLLGLILRVLLDWKSYDRAMRSAYLPGSLSGALRQSRLDLADNGLWIFRGDRHFHSPWKDVSGTEVEEGLLVITLCDSSEILIPRFSPGCAECDLEEIRRDIESLRRGDGESIS